jgi:hypothetical protein
MATRFAVLLGDAEADRKVGERLQVASHDLAVCGDWLEFDIVAASMGVGLVVADRLDQAGVQSGLNRRSREHAAFTLVLLTGSHPENLRLLGRVLVDEVIFASELDRLADLIARCGFADSFATVISAVRAADHLPVQLKRALLHVLEQEPSPCSVEPDDPAAPVRTIVALARRRGCTPDHLSRLACRNGIPLGRAIDCCIALRALQLISSRRVPPELTAWRLGFSGRAALSRHVSRSLGARLNRVRADDLPGWFTRLEKMLAGTPGREMADSVAKWHGPVSPAYYHTQT